MSDQSTQPFKVRAATAVLRRMIAAYRNDASAFDKMAGRHAVRVAVQRVRDARAEGRS